MNNILKGKFQTFEFSVTEGYFAEGKTGGQFLGNDREIRIIDTESVFEWLDKSERSFGYQFFTHS